MGILNQGSERVDRTVHWSGLNKIQRKLEGRKETIDWDLDSRFPGGRKRYIQGAGGLKYLIFF